MRNIYKLQIWVLPNEFNDIGEFRPFYFDVNRISGWYIPDNDLDDEGTKGINILFDGDMTTIKQEPHILRYLDKEFVKTATI